MGAQHDGSVCQPDKGASRITWDRPNARQVGGVLIEKFADGQWHTVVEIVATIGHLIPAEIAMRLYYRHPQEEDDNSPNRGMPVDQAVFLGKILWVRNFLREKIKRGREGFEVRRGPRRSIYEARIQPGVHLGRRGVQVHNAKLSPEMVRAIRKRWNKRHTTQETQADLARAFGVSTSTIYSVTSREGWRHVQEN